MTKRWLAKEVEQQLHDYFQRGSRGSKLIRHLAVVLAPDGESLLVTALYQDGRTSQTIFEGNVDVNDLDDIVAVTLEELANNADDVARRGDSKTKNVPMVAPAPFPDITHTREPASQPPWEGNWLPDRPILSVRLQRQEGNSRPLTHQKSDEGQVARGTNCAHTKETVSSLVQQVVDGKLDPTAAGQMMRSLVTVWKPATTWAERIERFNEAAIETDPNSFINVLALKDVGVLKEQDFAAIRRAMVGEG